MSAPPIGITRAIELSRELRDSIDVCWGPNARRSFDQNLQANVVFWLGELRAERDRLHWWQRRRRREIDALIETLFTEYKDLWVWHA